MSSSRGTPTSRIARTVARGAVLVALAATAVAAQQEPKPHKADEVKPYQAQEIEPYKAQEIKPAKPAEVPAARAQGIAQYHAHELKPLGAAGVDRVSPPGSFDRGLVGSWELAIPGVAYQTEADRGSYTERTLHTGAGAGFGRLAIARDGGYVWTKSGETARGRLVQVQPRRDAAAGATYWALRHGRESFYLTRGSDGQLAVYTVGANSLVATGRRAR